MSQDIQEHVVMVSGASRGIGLEIAKHFAHLGYKVSLCAKNTDRLQQAQKELQDISEQVLTVSCDVSVEADVQNWLNKTLDNWKRVDILVNNAGVTRDALVLRMNQDAWDSVLEINLRSVFLCTKAVLKPMMKQRSGKIINISSIVGLMGNPGQANYSASKAGMIGFTKSVAKEVASRGITVNAIAPGFIATDMTDQMSEQALEQAEKSIPMRRLGQAKDVAAAAAFLASPAASYITAEVLRVDGGLQI